LKFKPQNLLFSNAEKFENYSTRLKLNKSIHKCITTSNKPTKLKKKNIIKIPSQKSHVIPLSIATHQQHHLEYHLLPCDKSHDHRQTQT